jgi:ESS family glutamate:Na+ symporter
MVFSPWIAVLLAAPVLLAGEWLVKKIGWLDRFNIPAPVAGGLVVALAVLAVNLHDASGVSFQTGVTAAWWTWLVCAEPEWVQTPARNVSMPFLVAFFACIGLNASWSLIKRGSVQVLLFLGLTVLLAVSQNLVGSGLASLLGEPRLLGLMCGSVALTGGHGTMMGFAPEFETAGLAGAAVIGAASATFGVVAGGLLGGPVGGSLIRGKRLSSPEADWQPVVSKSSHATGIIPDLLQLAERGSGFWRHLLAVLFCVKAGAWISLGVQMAGIVFPVYMGALFLGVVVRNVAELFHKDIIRTRTVERISGVTLGIFLSVAMMSLNLIELGGVARLMLLILAAQVALMAVFARFVTFRVMGGDYDAAVMSAGQCGFGLGAMPNAIANMKALTEHYGPAERAFLVVPITGTFLIDLVNAVNIMVFLNLIRN